MTVSLPPETTAWMATDLADYLLLRGVTFRESHGAVGSPVRQAEEARVELHELPLAAFFAAHPTFVPDVLDALSAQASVDRRNVPDGTAVSAVKAQLDAGRAALP
jgi:argininosuccinate lyase